MASKTQIGNLALSHVGVTKLVADVESENSTEARVIRLNWDDAVDYVLRDYDWPQATAYVALGLVSGSAATPYNDDWIFAYRYPSDCLKVRRIVTSRGRRETEPIAFRIGRDGQGRLIFTNWEDATIEYTARITDPQEFEPMFVNMLSWYLASLIAPPLARQPEFARAALDMYEVQRTRAERGAANELQDPPVPEAEWIRDREGSGSGRGEDWRAYPSAYEVS